MALLITDMKVPVKAGEKELPAIIAGQFHIPTESVRALRLVRQSLDARKKQDIHFLVSALVTLSPLSSLTLSELHRGYPSYTCVATPEGNMLGAEA